MIHVLVADDQAAVRDGFDRHDRAALVALAYETQLIQPGDAGRPA